MTKTVLLGDVISQASLLRYDGSDYPVLSMTMHDGIVMQKDRFKKDISSTDKSNYKIVKKGQLVVGFPIDEGVIYIQDIAEKGIMSPAYNIWDVKQNLIDTKFLELCLHSPQSMAYYKSKLRGTTARRRSIPTEDLLNLRINLPDIKEQKKRTAYLRIVDSIIRKRRNQLELADTIVKSRFIELFGDLNISPKYPSVDLNSVCKMITGGTPSSKHPEYYGGNIPFVSTPCLGKNYIDEKDAVYFITEEGLKNSTTHLIPAGSLMFGNRVGVGKSSINKCAMCTNQDIVSITNVDSQKFDLLFIKAVLDQFSSTYDNNKRGATIKGIPTSVVKATQIPNVSINVQHLYTNFVKQVDKSKLAVQQSLNELETLKKSLMQQYFG